MTRPIRFADRREAGRVLAAVLEEAAGPDAVVLGLARGGVPVAAEVARVLGIPLDVLVVRKIGAPEQPELGIGAVAEEGVRVLDTQLVAHLGVPDEHIARVAAREEAELARRVAAYRSGSAAVDLTGRTAVIVDDGLATGISAAAAVRAAERRGATRVVVAAPVCAPEGRDLMRRLAAAVVCAHVPEEFRAVSLWYGHFPQLTDEDVRDALATA